MLLGTGFSNFIALCITLIYRVHLKCQLIVIGVTEVTFSVIANVDQPYFSWLTKNFTLYIASSDGFISANTACNQVEQSC